MKSTWRKYSGAVCKRRGQREQPRYLCPDRLTLEGSWRARADVVDSSRSDRHSSGECLKASQQGKKACSYYNNWGMEKEAEKRDG